MTRFSSWSGAAFFLVLSSVLLPSRVWAASTEEESDDFASWQAVSTSAADLLPTATATEARSRSTRPLPTRSARPTVTFTEAPPSPPPPTIPAVTPLEANHDRSTPELTASESAPVSVLPSAPQKAHDYAGIAIDLPAEPAANPQKMATEPESPDPVAETEPEAVATARSTPQNTIERDRSRIVPIAPRVNFANPSPTGQILPQTAVNPPARQARSAVMAQVPSAAQFRDVNPGDWAYGALDDLVTRYDCVRGYPDGTFRGDRALSRYEFAAGLNACLQQIERLTTQTTGELAKREDFETLRRLMQDFESELATVGAQVDDVEARSQFLEDHAFSTTTKLFGQVVFGLQGRVPSESDITSGTVNDVIVLAQDGVSETPDQANELNLGYNVQLSLLTQFSPRQFLLTGLQAGNIDTRDTSTFGFNNPFTRLGYELDTANEVRLTDATYRQLVTPDFGLIVGPKGVGPVSVFRGPSRIEATGFGPISRFAQRNPILQIGAGDAGFGFDWQLAENVSLQGVYAASTANDPNQGLLSGGYVAGVQLLLTPDRALDIALNYLHSYSGSLGGFLGVGVGDDQVSGVGGSRLLTNAFGATLSWDVAPKVTLGTWLGFTDSQLVTHEGRVQTVNWMFSALFPDLGGEGNSAGFFFGQPPRITASNLRDQGTLTGNVPSLFVNSTGTSAGGRDDRALHFEAFYQMQLTDDIALTPGFILVLNPNHSAGSDPILIGAIRTTFRF